VSSEKIFDQALRGLTKSLQQGRLAQAYLVVGDLRGSALALTTRVLGLLFCANKYCGTCLQCRQIIERTHPDIYWVEPQKKSRIIDVNSIRELQKRVCQTSFLGGWKAVVIMGADRLGTAGQDASGNAFLKTLEEPPPRTLFLLLTDSQDLVMTTIRSRCQRITLGTDDVRFEYPWRDALMELLRTGVDAGPVLLGLKRNGMLATLIAGIRKRIGEEEECAAASLKEQGGADADDDEIEARIESRYRGERDALLRAMLAWYRDLLVLQQGGAEDVLYFPAERQLLRTRAALLSYREAMGQVRIIEDLQRQLGRISRADDTVFASALARLKV